MISNNRAHEIQFTVQNENKRTFVLALLFVSVLFSETSKVGRLWRDMKAGRLQ